VLWLQSLTQRKRAADPDRLRRPRVRPGNGGSVNFKPVSGWGSRLPVKLDTEFVWSHGVARTTRRSARTPGRARISRGTALPPSLKGGAGSGAPVPLMRMACRCDRRFPTAAGRHRGDQVARAEQSTRWVGQSGSVKNSSTISRFFIRVVVRHSERSQCHGEGRRRCWQGNNRCSDSYAGGWQGGGELFQAVKADPRKLAEDSTSARATCCRMAAARSAISAGQ